MRDRVPGRLTNVSRPEDAVVVDLLGGASFEGVTFTQDQFKALLAYYGYSDAVTEESIENTRKQHQASEEARKKEHDKQSYSSRAFVPRHFDEAGLRDLLEAGGSRNIFRAVQRDGLRIMGLLSRFLDSDEDPVEFVEALISNAGYDCMLSDWEPFSNQTTAD